MDELLHNGPDEQEEHHWLSVSDLMAGLMMVFLFISIALMLEAFMERDQIKDVAVAYQENQVAIFNALNEEFRHDLREWDAIIDEDTLTFTFQSPDVLFKTGEIELSASYKSLLNDFFPRYMKALEAYRPSINEIRIEGHTSSVWNSYTSKQDSYFNNMELSQGRTRAVLNYVYRLRSSAPYREWITSHIAAVGLSSSKLIRKRDGAEDMARSRRVSFRVITNADIQIKRILERG